MENQRPLESLSDDELLRRLAELLHQSRRSEVDLVAHIGEVDERKLYAREAAPSMFAYCTDVLHLSEAEAYLRIGAARASRAHPMLLTMLGDGRLHLTAIAKLAPHLTRENRDAILKRATHASKRRIEELVAEMAPRPDVPAAMRKLPERQITASAMPVLTLGLEPAIGLAGQLRPDAVGSPTRAHVPPAFVQPLAPARYKVQFTASAGLHDKLERLRGLMRSQVPDGDLAAIIERAVTEKLERLEARRFASTKAPRKGLAETAFAPSSRQIPAAVRRAVRERDGDRCRFVDEQGRRCPERHHVEYHHRLPFGFGGDHSPTNLRLLCGPHNRYVAEHDYGKEAMARFRGAGHRASETIPSSDIPDQHPPARAEVP